MAGRRGRLAERDGDPLGVVRVGRLDVVDGVHEALSRAVAAISRVEHADERGRWILLADGALQVFDTAMTLATGKGVLALAPAVLAALDGWAGVSLLRGARSARPDAR